MTGNRLGKPRVALIGPFPPTKGGITTFMLNLMDSHLKEEYEFVEYGTKRPYKVNVVNNYGYGAIFRGGFRRTLHGIFLAIWRLAQFPYVLHRRRVDIVQIQASDYHVYWESIAYAILGRLSGRRVLLRIGGAFDIFHGTSPGWVKALIARSLKVPHCVITQSRFAHDYVRAAGRTGPTIILPNWTREPVAADAERPPNPHPVFMFSATAEAIRKGFEEVVEAARRLDATDCPARFHLLAMAPALIERVQAMGLKNMLLCEGIVEHSRMLHVMRTSDVFLLPSHGEGFPNSLVEAMAAGLPSIVTPIAAVPEMVADGGAIVVPVKDPAALAAAIDRLARDPALRRTLGEEARHTVLDRYTGEKALPPLAGAYRQLLA